jgi:hypothetical protein
MPFQTCSVSELPNESIILLSKVTNAKSKYFSQLGKIGENCGLRITFEACRRAGIVAVSARQLKPIKITDVEVNNLPAGRQAKAK